MSKKKISHKDIWYSGKNIWKPYESQVICYSIRPNHIYTPEKCMSLTEEI